MPNAAPAGERRGGAYLVAAGILTSRLVGFIRARIFAYYFGTTLASGAFNAAFRIPNMLQNLFGEGVLSASFIPTYAGLLGKGDEEEADRVAGAVLGLLSLATAVLVLLGLLFAPQIVHLIISEKGFKPESIALTIRLVRIFFPSAGLMVASAWCLGVLNSHRRFFLSYASPVIWNVAQIAALLVFGGRTDTEHVAQDPLYAERIRDGPLLQLAGQFDVFAGCLDDDRWEPPYFDHAMIVRRGRGRLIRVVRDAGRIGPSVHRNRTGG